MLADEGANEMELRKEQLRVLDQCISKLPDDRRELAITAYAGNNHPGNGKTNAKNGKALSIKCWQESECNYGVVSIANCQESQHDEKQHFRER